jgi:hypothetical protein
MASAPIPVVARVLVRALLLALVGLAPPAGSAEAAAGRSEEARVVATFGSGAAVVRNRLGQVYGVVYAGMDGSHSQQDVYFGFHQYASQANSGRVDGQTVRVEPEGLMGETPEGMLVFVGNLFLPGRDAPVAADLLGDGAGWYPPDPANQYDGLFQELEAVARAQHHGAWGWPLAVPDLGASPAPPAPPDFLRRPVPDAVAPGWDLLIDTPSGEPFAEAVERTGVRFQMANLPDAWAGYSPRANRIFLDLMRADESAPAVAVVLAHEITHAIQEERGRGDDCVQDEVEAFAAQSALWGELAGPRPPTRTRLEQQLTLIRLVYQRGGEPELRRLVEAQSGYQEECRLRD